MGEWTTVDLRKMAGALPFADMDRGIPETSNALRWAAERIEYLEKFIETTEREAVASDPYSVAGVKGYVPEDHPWANLDGHFRIEYFADAGDIGAGIAPWSCFVVSLAGQYEIEFNRLHELVYETGPGEFSPDGWTWKQAFQAEKKRREEAEAAIETLHEKYAQERMLRKRESLSDNTKMENQ